MDVLNVGQVYILIQPVIVRGKGLGSEEFLQSRKGQPQKIQKGLWLWRAMSSTMTKCAYSLPETIWPSYQSG